MIEALEQGVKKSSLVLEAVRRTMCERKMAQHRHLGITFFDKADEVIPQSQVQLKEIGRIDASTIEARLKEIEIFVACDVNNPLYGSNGASYVYGPQKGQIRRWLKSLTRILNNMLRWRNRQQEKYG